MEWSREVFERAVSSRCWSYTPYDGGWERCPELAADEELRRVVELEHAARPVPGWAREVAERSIGFLPGRQREPRRSTRCHQL